MAPLKDLSFSRFFGEFFICFLATPIFLGVYYGILDGFDLEVMMGGIVLILFPGLIVSPFLFLLHCFIFPFLIKLKFYYEFIILISILCILYLIFKNKDSGYSSGELSGLSKDYINVFIALIFLINGLLSRYSIKKIILK